LKDENDTAFILCWLPTKMAEWIGDNHGGVLGIQGLRLESSAEPGMLFQVWWQVGELFANNAILENNLVL
jgi:hypothetical protein